MTSATYFELFVICLILLLPFLYEMSHSFRYYFKFAVYYSVVSVNAIILIPPMLCRPCDVKNLLWASSFCHHISTVLGLKWELRGKEHLEKDQACIIVANHQSSLDILGMFDIWPVMNKCTVVAKRELFFAWPFGLAAWLCGLIFINRMQSDRARDQLCTATTNIKNKKIKLWIFPEGTRRNTGHLHPFKKGAFHVAIDAQIPILPVVFSSYRTFLDDTNKRLDSGKIIVSTLPPISTVGLNKADLDSLMAHTYNVMNKEYMLTTEEVVDQAKKSKQKYRIRASGARINTSPSSALASSPLPPPPPPSTSSPSSPSTSPATSTTTTKINAEHSIDYGFDENNVLNQYTFMHQHHHHRNVIPPTAN